MWNSKSSAVLAEWVSAAASSEQHDPAPPAAPRTKAASPRKPASRARAAKPADDPLPEPEPAEDGPAQPATRRGRPATPYRFHAGAMVTVYFFWWRIYRPTSPRRRCALRV